MTIVGYTLAGIFAALSILHVYWAIGGRWGYDVAIPTLDGRNLINPSFMATLTAATVLLLAAIVIIGRIGRGYGAVPDWFYYWASWVIAAVFFVRAVGDFRICGFFKRVRGTRFARWDTQLFSPLCLLIAALSAIVSLS